MKTNSFVLWLITTLLVFSTISGRDISRRAIQQWLEDPAFAEEVALSSTMAQMPSTESRKRRRTSRSTLSRSSCLSQGSERLRNSQGGRSPTNHAFLLFIPKSIKIHAYYESVIRANAPLAFKCFIDKILDFAEGFQTVLRSFKVSEIWEMEVVSG